MSERDVVKEELRQRVLADPYGRLFSIYLPQESFTDASVPTTGHRQHRRSWTPPRSRTCVRLPRDVLSARQRLPDRRRRLRPGAARRLGRQYFAPIERARSRALPSQRRARADAHQRAQRRRTTRPTCRCRPWSVSWQLPRYADPDAAALLVLDDILSTGASSTALSAADLRTADRGRGRLVHRPAAAGWLAAGLRADVRGTRVSTRARPRCSPRSTSCAMQPVTAAELDEAKRELIAGTLRSREGVLGRAHELGYSLILAGDPTAADRQLAAVQKVTAADVLRVARSTSTPELRVTCATSTTARSPPTCRPSRAPAHRRAPIKLADLAASGEPVTLAPEAERAALPGPSPVRRPHARRQRADVLANGLRVLVAPTHDVPLVSARLTFATVPADDPAGKTGLAVIAAGLAERGHRYPQRARDRRRAREPRRGGGCIRRLRLHQRVGQRPVGRVPAHRRADGGDRRAPRPSPKRSSSAPSVRRSTACACHSPSPAPSPRSWWARSCSATRRTAAQARARRPPSRASQRADVVAFHRTR